MEVAGGKNQKDLIDQIYEAAVLPEFWPGVLAQLASISNTAWSTLVATRGSKAAWVTSDPEADELVKAHFEHFHGNMRTARLLAKPYPGFVTDHDLLTQQEIDAEPVYQGFLIPRGFGFGVATSIAPSTGDIIALHCEGRFSDGPIPRAAVERLDEFRPHLGRAALLSAQLAFERERTAVETLATLGFAACAVASDGAVLLANSAFDKEIAYWTTRRKDRVVLRDRFADLLLQAAFATSLSSGSKSVLSVPLRAAKGSAPAVLHVVPVRRAARDIFSRAAMILVLTKANGKTADATPLLELLFDLTAAESKVAAGLATGKTIEEIAAADGKSVNTIRNQLRKVMEKTGCRRQADLVLVLSQLLPW